MTPVAPTRQTRRQFLTRALGAGVGAAAALGGLGAAQAYGFGVTRQVAALPRLRTPLCAAFLTDLHSGPLMRPRHVRAWVEAANAARPDVVLLGGDYTDRSNREGLAALLAELARLRAPLGVYGVWGNHDYGAFWGRGQSRPGAPVHRPVDPAAPDSSVPDPAVPDHSVQARMQAAAAFARAGVVILRNGGRAVRDDLYVGGTDDVLWGTPDARAALAGAGTRATVLLSHNPDLLPELPQPAGLVLCGHTHGGQVRLPGLGALPGLVPSRYGARYDMGWKTGAFGTPAYVSRGLGVTGLPVRHLCPPELALLTLVPGPRLPGTQ